MTLVFEDVRFTELINFPAPAISSSVSVSMPFAGSKPMLVLGRVGRCGVGADSFSKACERFDNDVPAVLIGLLVAENTGLRATETDRRLVALPGIPVGPMLRRGTRLSSEALPGVRGSGREGEEGLDFACELEVGIAKVNCPEGGRPSPADGGLPGVLGGGFKDTSFPPVRSTKHCLSDHHIFVKSIHTDICDLCIYWRVRVGEFYAFSFHGAWISSTRTISHSRVLISELHRSFAFVLHSRARNSKACFDSCGSPLSIERPRNNVLASFRDFHRGASRDSP
jgi:hypothetical protein